MKNNIYYWVRWASAILVAIFAAILAGYGFNMLFNWVDYRFHIEGIVMITNFILLLPIIAAVAFVLVGYLIAPPGIKGEKIIILSIAYIVLFFILLNLSFNPVKFLIHWITPSLMPSSTYYQGGVLY